MFTTIWKIRNPFNSFHIPSPPHSNAEHAPEIERLFMWRHFHCLCRHFDAFEVISELYTETHLDKHKMICVSGLLALIELKMLSTIFQFHIFM